MSLNESTIDAEQESSPRKFFELIGAHPMVATIMMQSVYDNGEIFAWERALLQKNLILFEAFVKNGLKIGHKGLDLLRKFINEKDYETVKVMSKAQGLLAIANKYVFVNEILKAAIMSYRL